MVVVGAGAVGAAVAWSAAREQLAGEVVLVDPDPGSGASRVAGGMLAPITEAWPGEQEVLELGAASLARWPAFAEAVAADAGGPVGLRTEGTLQVATDAADVADLDRVVEHLRAWGRDVERLSGREVRRREPALGPAVRAGLAVPDDLAVDNRALLAALTAAGRARGVVTARRRVTRVLDDGARVTGVELGDDVLEADRVVVAAGAWSSALHPALADRVRPVKGEILRVRARRSSLPPPVRTVRAAVSGRPVYAVPRDERRVVVGATQYEAGFDPDVLVGGVRDLIADVERVLPGIADYALEETAASFRPGTDDNLPLLGPVGPSGLVAATGHGRNGMLLVAVTVDAITAVLRGEALPDAARPAAADRWAPGARTVDGGTTGARTDAG
ncbi:glycine oxidase ThiO [Actinomycetospora cinnamomea]|uniref:glycine oxidase n=1 Tax=Actinomycetospora cinnamomea TaxID=663609 RepID=A0A2U1FLL9_9PSEU|nr:glycine oxidase ThiO [Actinomycetospora cinnamomea]PVZ13067.1 glycine oxidase [Actinomycetospora cinnamomea]